jgi:hypothetical protein
LPKSASAQAGYVESLSVVIYCAPIFLKPLLERIAAANPFYAADRGDGRTCLALKRLADFLHRRQNMDLLWTTAHLVLRRRGFIRWYLLVRPPQAAQVRNARRDLHPKPRKPLYH